jgi:Lon protease-like protein
MARGRARAGGGICFLVGSNSARNFTMGMKVVYFGLSMTHLPLFPLNLVLFPNFPLPLHIFEERYRLMIRRCMEEAVPFGVVCQHGEHYERIGCTALVDHVLKEYEDGRMDIVTVGRERFAIENVDESELYLQASVQLLEEPDEPDDEQLMTKAVDGLLRYAYYAEMEIDRAGLRELDARELSYLLSGLDSLGLQTKQLLLETDSHTERLQRSVAAIQEVTEQLLVIAQLKKAIGTDVDLSSLNN